MIGCGILSKEICYLMDKYHWPIETVFLDSSLHTNFDKLFHSLQKSLNFYKDREKVVFYGACHPGIDTLLSHHNTTRTMGQNCVQLLLGKEVFSRELMQGAFFLMEDWVLRWDSVVQEALGPDIDAARHLFQSEHNYFLGIKTPCSGNFSEAAQAISDKYGLPLKWMPASLALLEKVLRETLKGIIDER